MLLNYGHHSVCCCCESKSNIQEGVEEHFSVPIQKFAPRHSAFCHRTLKLGSKVP